MALALETDGVTRFRLFNTIKVMIKSNQFTFLIIRATLYRINIAITVRWY